MKITRGSGTLLLVMLSFIIPILCGVYFGSDAELGAIIIFGALILIGLVLTAIYYILARFVAVKPLFWVVIILLFGVNIWIAYGDRERNRMKEEYDVSTKEFEKLYLAENDSTLFKKLKSCLNNHFYPSIQKKLASNGDTGLYNKKGIRTNSVTDSITEYTVDHIIFNRKEHIVIYFITYIGSEYANPNDSMKGGFVFAEDYNIAYAGVISATVDSNNNWIKFYKPEFTREGNTLNVKEPYKSPHIDGSSSIIRDLRESNVKYFIVNYKYGSNTFWKGILTDLK